MTARPETTPSESVDGDEAVGDGGAVGDEGGDGGVEAVLGEPFGVTGGVVPGVAEPLGAGGVGAVAPAPAGTATTERQVAANAAPHTSTLRTPGPFLAEPGAHIIRS
jgi:hypothetical protein